MFVRLPDIYLTVFGYQIKIGGGENCGPVDTMKLQLDSFPFVPSIGGLATGTYTLDTVKKCGIFNVIVNGMVAGEGNTITLDLTTL